MSKKHYLAREHLCLSHVRFVSNLVVQRRVQSKYFRVTPASLIYEVLC